MKAIMIIYSYLARAPISCFRTGADVIKKSYFYKTVTIS